MKAWIYEKYGPSEVLELRDIPMPVPVDDQVLVRVEAVSINDWDWQLLLGIPFANRMMNGFFRPRKKVLGSDIAGRIEAVGPGVDRFEPGDEVYGDLSGMWGGFAEYVCPRQDALEKKPSGMSFEEASAVPQAAMLAVQGLRDAGQLQPGEKLLINGAGGGVGTFGIQLARLYEGVDVTGVDSGPKLDMLRRLGFDHVIDYTRTDFTKTGQQYDLILDTKTNRPVSHYLRVLLPGGRYVTVGGSVPRLLAVFLSGALRPKPDREKLYVAALKANRDLLFMNELYEAGLIKPVIDGPCLFDELPRAMHRFGEGIHKGKLVLTAGRSFPEKNPQPERRKQ